MLVVSKFCCITIILCWFTQNAISAPRVDPLVDTKVGLIRGLQASDGDYAMFLGIPYAKVEDDNPFGPSISFPKFDETFEAYNDSAICPQMENLSSIGSLDCLHLNVYVPNTASSENRLPVMVWIYGGGFSIGNFGRNLYGPKNLVKHDIILVTLNYRVGPYGFMCLDTPKVPGNQGLKDQQLALKWVKDNIKAFGGDDNEITIFGESAGGASVDLQLYYGKDTLFNKVILQSGNALCPWAVYESDELVHSKIAKHLGFESNDNNEILAFLSTTSPELIIAASESLNLVFRPCVEKKFENVEQFIGKYPINTNIEKIRDFPILIGHNNDESFELLNIAIDLFQDVFNETLLEFFNFDSKPLAAMEKYIRNFYIGDELISASNILSVIDFESDFTFNYPTVRSVNRYIENGAEELFYYVFSYNGNNKFLMSSETNVYNISSEGAMHADELGYLFHQPNNDDPTPEDQAIIEQVTTLWTNFAKTGNPTPAETDVIPLIWPPVSSNSMTYLNIDSELSVKQRPFHDRMAFWDLFYELNNKAQKGYLDDE